MGTLGGEAKEVQRARVPESSWKGLDAARRFIVRKLGGGGGVRRLRRIRWADASSQGQARRSKDALGKRSKACKGSRGGNERYLQSYTAKRSAVFEAPARRKRVKEEIGGKHEMGTRRISDHGGRELPRLGSPTRGGGYCEK